MASPDSMDMSLSKLWELVKDREALVCCSPWGCKESELKEKAELKVMNSRMNNAEGRISDLKEHWKLPKERENQNFFLKGKQHKRPMG